MSGHSYQIFIADPVSREVVGQILDHIQTKPVGNRKETWYQRVMRLDQIEVRRTHKGTRIILGVFATIEVNKVQDIMSETEEGIEKAIFDPGKGLAEVHGILYDEESGLLMLERKGGGKLVSRFAAYLKKHHAPDKKTNKSDKTPVHFHPVYGRDALEALAKFRTKSFTVTAHLAHEPQLLGEFIPNTRAFQKAFKNEEFDPEVTLSFKAGAPDADITQWLSNLWSKADDKDSFDRFVIKGTVDDDGGKVDTIKLTEYPMQKYVGKADEENIATADGDYDRLKNTILYAWNKYEGELKASAKKT